jgi:N-acetylneuraminate synthase
LIETIASFGKPIILSTGMNDLDSIRPAVEILRKSGAGFALLHCTSIYPTPYNRIRLGALTELKQEFPDAVVGLSDHSLTNYPCLGAVALGASILERHYTSDKSWPGPDIEVSMDPKDLRDLIEGSRAIFESRGGRKEILEDEMATIKFAYASVVAISDIKAGELLSEENIWVKRPGTGQIMAKSYPDLLGRRALVDIPKNQQLKWCQLDIESSVTEVA